MLNIRRLEASNPSDWELYPAFEERVKVFCDTYLLRETNWPRFQQELRARWLFQPQDCGYFVADSFGKVVGHACAWIASIWDKKYVFVYQLELDWGDKPGMRRCFGSFITWIRSTGLPDFEFQTPHDVKLFSRYLSQFGIEAVKIRSVIRASLPKE